jgi:Txe/YoeB family toxin of Txe-Axe toxin-antitoxin module
VEPRAATLTDLARPHSTYVASVLLGRTRNGFGYIDPGINRLEPLKGNREGQHSVRINDQYRICFLWTDTGPAEVEITDYH